MARKNPEGFAGESLNLFVISTGKSAGIFFADACIPLAPLEPPMYLSVYDSMSVVFMGSSNTEVSNSSQSPKQSN